MLLTFLPIHSGPFNMNQRTPKHAYNSCKGSCPSPPMQTYWRFWKSNCVFKQELSDQRSQPNVSLLMVDALENSRAGAPDWQRTLPCAFAEPRGAHGSVAGLRLREQTGSRTGAAGGVIWVSNSNVLHLTRSTSTNYGFAGARCFCSVAFCARQARLKLGAKDAC